MAEVYIGGFRLVGTCVDFGGGEGQSEPILFVLLLIFVEVSNSGGCRHVVCYCAFWLSCSTL